MYVTCRQDYNLNQTQKYMYLKATFSLVNTDISPMTERGNMHITCSTQQNFFNIHLNNGFLWEGSLGVQDRGTCAPVADSC